jgi:ribosomal protein S6
MEEKDNRVYELAYHVVPTLSEDKVMDEVTKLKALFEGQGGVFISEEAPKFMDLQYEMRVTINNKNERFVNSYFGWMKYEVSPEGAVFVNESLKRSETIFRYIVLKTVKENTIASKKPVVRREAPKAEGAVEEVSVEAVAPEVEGVDKEIEALVTE